MVAVAQRYEELHPGVRIHWDKRTLDEFGHKPIDQLAEEYDLIVIDHPWAGFCFEKNLVVDLLDYLSVEQQDDLSQNTIGLSYHSYRLDNKLLAIPIDAATPAASRRPDLMDQHGLRVPVSWEELIKLADRKQAIMPGFGADLFLNWLMLLHAVDAHPFEGDEHIADQAKAIDVMTLLKRLAEPMPDEIFDWNPIMVAEVMTGSDLYAYCPFAYSYGNYCRPSFVKHPLKYGPMIQLNNQPLRSILGGTGLAITRSCSHIDLAVDFSLFCADKDVQSNIYSYAGGQPVRNEAWQSDRLDKFAGGFFSESFEAHENAILRPRYNGYVSFQGKAGNPLQQYVKGEITAKKAWDRIDELYRASYDPH